MKKLYMFKSEIDNSMHICSNVDLAKFIKKHNQEIRISAKLKIKPWTLVCDIEFQRDQSANDFGQFLETKTGLEFANKHFFFNPFSELNKLLAVLPKTCQFYVMGGFALDGHLGKLTRRHDDVDLICWRKDINLFKKALRQIGYKVREKYAKDNPKLLILLETDEENPAIEVKIIDEQPNNCFRFHFNVPGKQIFPKKLLGPKQVALDGLKFPAVSLQLMAALNRLTHKNFRRIKKENPKLYKVLGYKIDNCKNDRKLLDELIKKSV